MSLATPTLSSNPSDVALGGTPSKSALYSWKEIPATTSGEDPLASSPWRNVVFVLGVWALLLLTESVAVRHEI